MATNIFEVEGDTYKVRENVEDGDIVRLLFKMADERAKCRKWRFRAFCWFALAWCEAFAGLAWWLSR